MRLLFIGGCKSGKSSTAQRMARALACGKPMYYWATMEPHDGEDSGPHPAAHRRPRWLGLYHHRAGA